MTKSAHARRRRAKPLRRTPLQDGTGLRHESPALRDTPSQRRLLDRILDTPHLASAIPQLQPEVLHRVIQTCGLEDCGEFVALATPDQLARVFDLDLWRAREPGLDEELDADRFGVWLQVLMESSATVAAQKLIGMDIDLVIAALAQHVRVFDRAAVSPAQPPDGDEPAECRGQSDAVGCEIGNYMVEVRRGESWDTIVDLLLFLDAQHPDYFHCVMRGCRRLSSSKPEIDGLHDLLADSEQDMFDLAFDRETRREKQGYVTPAQARAFLEMARQLRLEDETMPSPNPVARAYFRAIEWRAPADVNRRSSPLLPSGPPPPAKDAEDAIAAVVDVLIQAGVLTQQPRALLDGPQGRAPRYTRIQAQMQFAADSDHAAHSMRIEELAYLANTIVAGCSIQARPFTEREASDAALAVCNLGLENWPHHWLQEKAGRDASSVDTGPLPEGFLVDHDLVSVFQVGWKILHGDVCMYAAKRLIEVLTDLRCDDREIQTGLDALRVNMARHWQAGTPWRARDALDVIAILDMPAWATLLGLIDEYPVIHAGIRASQGPGTRSVSASAFEFISENSQIASVHNFMDSLPATLRC